MTGRGGGAKLPEPMKHIANLYLSLADPFLGQERRTGAVVQGSSGLGGAPAKDKKTPKKKEKESNKKIATLKNTESNKKLAALEKKAAQLKAKRSKTDRDLERIRLLESTKKHKEIIERRKLLIQKNKEKLKNLNAKKKLNTKRDK